MRSYACILLVAAGCSSSVAPRRLPVPQTGSRVELAGEPFGVPGEQMRYDVSFRSISVARIDLAVGQPGEIDGRPAIIVHSRATTAGLLAILKDAAWDLKTTLDLETGWVIATSEHFSGTVNDERHEKKREKQFSDGTHNIHSFFGALRIWDPPMGTTADVRIYIAGRFRLEITAAGHEVLNGRPAIRVDGVTSLGPNTRFSIWIADDRHRPPLRVRFETRWGDVDIVLIGYDA